MILADVLAWQGLADEAESWAQHGERTIRAEAEPADAVALIYVRGLIELAHGRDADALAAFRTAERLAGLLAAPHMLVLPTRTRLLQALVRLGAGRARRAGPCRTRRKPP